MEKSQFEENMKEIFDLPDNTKEDNFEIPTNISDILKETSKEENEIEDLDKDYKTVRNNLKDIIKKGTEAIDGILMVASEGQSPRAYEVVSQLIKSVSDANKDLVELHKKMKEIKREDENISRGPSTVNNSIFVGSTKELQELLKTKKKELNKLSEDDVVDV